MEGNGDVRQTKSEKSRQIDRQEGGTRQVEREGRRWAEGVRKEVETRVS